jgi:sugar lactone lactonase YvrE
MKEGIMFTNLKMACWCVLLIISSLFLSSCGGGGGNSAPAGTLPTATTLASGLTNALALTVDSSNIYWTESADGTTGTGTITVKMIGIAGGTVTTLASSQRPTSVYAWDIAVDSDSVYWIEQYQNNLSSLKKVELNSGTVTELVSDPARPLGLAMDSSALYYTDYNGGTINKIDKTGGTPTILASGQNQPHYIAIDSTYVYWVNDGDGSINKVAINGGSVTNIASVTMPAMYRPWASHIIAVDSASLYFIDNPTGTTGTINKVGLTGGTVTTLWSSPTIIPDSIAVDSSNVYWSGGSSIYKIGKNGGTASQVQTNLLPCFIGLDATSIYFSDLKNVSKVDKW